MIIFLGIVGELATVIGSIAIAINAGFDSILEISKNGYKIDKRKFDEIKKKQTEERKKSKLFNRILGIILFLTPGINLIDTSIRGAKFKKTLMNNPQFKEAIIPMTEKEKELYATMKAKSQKLAFATTIYEQENELLIGNGNCQNVVNHGLISLNSEELMPLDYTLNEVKKLNEATTYSYRIGQIDGQNVAVIGIPNSDSPVSRIQFKSEDYKITHTYEKMTEEEAYDKTFTVYLFTTDKDIQVDVEKVVQEIKLSRIDSAIAANFIALNVFAETFSVYNGHKDNISEDTLKEQAPVLKKTMNPRNKNK